MPALTEERKLRFFNILLQQSIGLFSFIVVLSDHFGMKPRFWPPKTYAKLYYKYILIAFVVNGTHLNQLIHPII